MRRRGPRRARVSNAGATCSCGAAIALVAVDVRGTGASFGTRDSFRSPRERDDYARIAEWVVAQPWSDGRIGATGVS